MTTVRPMIGKPDGQPAPLRTWSDALLSLTTTLAFAGLFASIGVLGLLVFLPRSAPAVQRHAAVEQLFVGPKIHLRAEALGRVSAEASR